MPCSAFTGKVLTAIIISKLHAKSPIARVIDIGPGEGSYARLIRPLVSIPEWIGVEVWPPYIKEYDLASVYDQVIISDARWFDFSLVGSDSLAIFGDVLEHMSRDDALKTVNRALVYCKAALISLPIGSWPQDAIGDNNYEKHVQSWTNEDVVKYLPNLAGYVYFRYHDLGGIGVALCAGYGAAAVHVRDAISEAQSIVGGNGALQDHPLGLSASSLDPAVVAKFSEMVTPYIFPLKS